MKMTRQEYMEALAQALSGLSPDARNAALTFYQEMLDDSMEEDGLTEEEAVAAMEDVAVIAAQVKEEEAEAAANLPPAVLSDEIEEKKAVYPADALNVIRIRARDCGIRFEPAPDGRITLNYHTSPWSEYRHSCENGVLLLENTASRPRIFSGFRFFGASPAIPPITLSLPADALLDLDLATTNASILGHGLRSLCAARLLSSNAKIALEDVICKSLKINTSNGKITLVNIESKQSIRGNTSDSRIEGRNVKSGEEMHFITSNGKIQAEEISAGTNLTLTTSNGNISLHCLRAAGITLRTSNGKIQGTLPGCQADWAIESATTNGKNNLPKHQEGEKPLTVRTSNGNINLEFGA